MLQTLTLQHLFFCVSALKKSLYGQIKFSIFNSRYPMFLLLLIDYLCVLAAVIADLVSGLRKARQRGEKCTSSGLRRTVDKIGRYYLALFSMTVIDVMLVASLDFLKESGFTIIPAFPYLTSCGALALALIEVKSICEHSDEKGDLRQVLTNIISILTRLPNYKI